MLSLPADPARVATASTAGMTAVLPEGLAAAVGACADARGWKPPTTAGVLRAMAVLIELGSFELTDQVVAVLRADRLPVTRVREFLDASGLATDADETSTDWMQAPRDARSGSAPRWSPGSRCSKAATAEAELAARTRSVTTWVRCSPP